MSLEITGKLVQKSDTIQVSEKFKKREFTIEMAEEINGNVYTNYGKFQLVQNKCDIIDRFKGGDMVKVMFNIKGNSYVDKKDGQTKYITNLDAWRVELAGGGQSAPQQTPSGAPAPAPPVYQPPAGNFGAPPAFNPGAGTLDDLPF